MGQTIGLVENAIPSIRDDPQMRHCIQCGTCSGVCPMGYFMDYPPSRMIAALRSETYSRVTSTESVWLCISCSACTSFCPTLIPITENLMTRTKEEMILAGNVPTELQTALENSQRYGNPFGDSPRKRINWITPEIKVPILGSEIREVEYLWFVGDYASYHPLVSPASQAFARLLNLLGLNFGILGNEEKSDGDSQRLAGERGLFEVLAEKNAKLFSKYSFKEIITTDPHAYNAIKNAYPGMGINYPIRHYTQLLAEKLDVLKPMLVNEIKAKVTYHDPCYLGRVNGIYDEPRALLNAIPGVEYMELPHFRSNSLCCGGGGGGMWMDGYTWEKAHVRLSELRVAEAAHTGADILAVACPYEAARFEDATKTVKNAGKLLIKDISELLIRSISQSQ
jgi:dimethylglycine catabolism B